jgi:hypothetical protein
VVVVEHQPHNHAALDRRLERRYDRGSGTGIEPQVVDGDVEGLGGASQKPSDSLSDRIAALASVGQKVELERRG